MFAALDIIQRAGFTHRNVKILAPTHPARPDWFKSFPEDAVFTLVPEHWHKRELLRPKAVQARLAEYFGKQDFVWTSVVASRDAQELNGRLQRTPSDKRLARLKRVFEVRLKTTAGETQTRYVLAKSVGWGWLGYRAFLIGHQLSGHVPPILGLRDGILFMEWAPHQPSKSDSQRDKQILAAAASYTAARVRRLNLGASTAGMDLKRSNNGHLTLAYALSRAYGRFLPQKLMRPRVAAKLRTYQCPVPTLVDGNMRRDEWILASQEPLKTDYEHHGMGKLAVNVIDPAYDLADTILHFELSEAEESRFIQQYIAESGDHTVEQRLFLHKLLAGLWAINSVQEQLFDTPCGGDAQQHYHVRFMNAWNFLTVQTARHCGSLCHRPEDLRWRAPLVFLDLDGVVDRRLFGFPATTAAGIKALSLLSAHEYSVALNTARSAPEVKHYCSAYSLAGGVAEYGSYLWDAVHQREQVLISTEAAHQLEKMRKYLRGIPGVFLDERHQYSIRAFSYQRRSPERVLWVFSSESRSSIGDGVLAPISPHIVQQLFVDLRLDKLTFLQNSIDTTVVAAENNKGTGLTALRDWVLTPGAEAIAIGDDEPDLEMFRVASRSFAPAQIACRQQARLLGCGISRFPYQQGLLEIVRRILHPDSTVCKRCDETWGPANASVDMTNSEVFWSAIEVADRKWTANFLSAVGDPTIFRLLIR
jgi:hydroxymethylpyrimidine pyrophosphatase-like HAD family hydrolase